MTKYAQRWLIAMLLVAAPVMAIGLVATQEQASMAADGIIYVDADATGLNDGSTWENAYTDLQSALDAAPLFGDEIWVAAGIYTPTVEYGGTGDRYKSFQMKSGVAIYGGFTGTETNLEERDWAANVTVLSGDLNGDDGPDFANNGENSYHVFCHVEGTNLDGTATLDGFTISGGNANGSTYAILVGGGMYNDGSSPALTNCIFTGNSAGSRGGGMHNDGSTPTLTSCNFSGNSATLAGGGMYNTYSSPVLANCTFSGNSADYGGGLYDYHSFPTLTDCAFQGNLSAERGGGMYNSHSSPTLTGCTFEGNTSENDGGGMYNSSSSPVVIGCTFEGNSAQSGGGGGLFNEEYSSPILTDSIFESNWAENDGGGMYNVEYSSPVLTSCIFSNNSTARTGGGVFSFDYSSPVFANCTFSKNSAAGGGGLCNLRSSPVLTNCTFIDNLASTSGGGIYNAYSSPTLTNCILWRDDPNEIQDQDSQAVVAYSDIQGGYSGEGNIDADPLFMDPDNGDYHLESNSPCIDTGYNDAPNLPAHDFEGDPRVMDGNSDGMAIVDMGIDEAWGRTPDVIYVDQDAARDGDGTSWEDAFTHLQTALSAAAYGDEIWVAEGIYTPTLEFSPGDPRSASFQLKNGVALYGGFDPTVGDIAWDHRDWDANPTILSGDLNGDDGPDFENNGENSYHVFYHPDGTNLDDAAILDGFAIIGGNAEGDWPSSHGGGMYNEGSSPILANCAFSGNSAYWGGGMVNSDSSPTLTNCNFVGNFAHNMGGGMDNSFSSPTLINCTFTDNSATTGGGLANGYSDTTLINVTFAGNSAVSGGGMDNHDASPKIVNCAFVGNSAVTGGGMYHFTNTSVSPVLTNCIFADNLASDLGGGMYNYSESLTPILVNCIMWGNAPQQVFNYHTSSSAVITYSDVQGGYFGEGNIDAYPWFANPDIGDFHLGACSPCIDKGDNSAPDLPDSDFEGDPRVLDADDDGTATVDMGVDEVAAAGTCSRLYLPVALRSY